MKIKFDKEANVIYIRFKEGKIVESDEIKEGLIIDYDSEGNPIAIEILNARDIISGKPEIIGDFLSIS
jgi:uncharacterized protein YuzE